MSCKKLLEIYALYDTWAQEFEFACEKGCSECCTQSVSMTTLEGELIHEYIHSEKQELVELLHSLPQSYMNLQTTNRFAADCLAGKEPEDDVSSWNMAPCVFLRDNCCTIYPVRSFMCRSFGSKVPCHQTGTAEVEPIFLTLNTVILQCLEHLDQGRPWGNMYTILQLVKEKREGLPGLEEKRYRIAERLPGFLIPPDEMTRMQKYLQILQKCIGI